MSPFKDKIFKKLKTKKVLKKKTRIFFLTGVVFLNGLSLHKQKITLKENSFKRE